MAEQAQKMIVVDDDPLDAYVDEMLEEKDRATELEVEKTDEVEATAKEESEEVVEEEAVEEEVEFVEIKHNGKSVKLAPEEVLDFAQKGFDYTQKTQELSDARKQLDAQVKQFQARVEQNKQFQEEFSKIAAMDIQLQQYKEVDWDKWSDDDPQGSLKGFQRYQRIIQQRNDLASALGQRQAQMSQEMRQTAEKRISDAQAQLAHDIGKDWTAETKAALRQTGIDLGFTEDEVDFIDDPRVIKTLYEVFQYRKLKASAPAVTKKVAEAPKLAKPGAKPVNQATAQTQQLLKALKQGKSRSVREKAAIGLLDRFV